MSFQLFCVCLRPSFPRNTTAYRTIPLPSHLFSHREPPMRFALFITTRRKAPEKRASPLPSSARRSDGRISKLFSATSRAGDAEDELNEARYKNLNCGCRGQNLILKRTHGPAKVSQGRYRLQVFSCRLPVIVTEARGTWNLRLRRITWG